MRTAPPPWIRRRAISVVGVVLGVALVLVPVQSAPAATPAAGTVSAAAPTTTWQGTAQESAPMGCTGPGDKCDRFALTVQPVTGGSSVEVTISTAQGTVNDFDLAVFDSTGKQIGSSGQLGTPPEVVTFAVAATGTYTVEVAPATVVPGTIYQGKARLIDPGTLDLTPTTSLYFRSAGGGFAQDLAADPTAGPQGRAPIGSTLSTTRPPVSDTTDATAEALAGGDSNASPSWLVPGPLAVSSLCVDVFLVRRDRPPGIVSTIFFDSAFKKPGGAAQPNEQLKIGSAPDEIVHLRSLVATATPALKVAAGDALSISAQVVGHSLVYDSAAHPSMVTVNPGAGTCGSLFPEPPAPLSPVAAPTYTTYVAPGTLANSAGEPTIGTSWKTGSSFFQASLQTLKVTFDNAPTPVATWTNVSPLETGLTSLDPILEVDSRTGQIAVSQLLGICSASAVSADDGATFTPSSGCPQPHGVDHQTIGGGPRAAGTVLPKVGAYDGAFYYCSQETATAFCGRSDDGGVTYGPSTPTYTLRQCGALHGHVQVAPNDGTVYVPNNSCGGQQAVAVSENGGLTWEVRKVTGSSAPANSNHPAVNIGADGTVYYGYESAAGHAMVSVSRDRGKTWVAPLDVGASHGIVNTEFPVVIAGDGDRAAVAFLGTTLGGNHDDANFGKSGDRFTNEWHLYVAHTYDRGASWVTTDTTPDDPVQRGCISNSGTTSTNGCRNLLDFNGISVDKQGRVLVGWSDGCTGACRTSSVITDNTRTRKGTITRLTSGTGLFAQFDGTTAAGVDPTTPGAPSSGAGTKAVRSGRLPATGPTGSALWGVPFAVAGIVGFRFRRRLGAR